MKKETKSELEEKEFPYYGLIFLLIVIHYLRLWGQKE